MAIWDPAALEDNDGTKLQAFLVNPAPWTHLQFRNTDNHVELVKRAAAIAQKNGLETWVNRNLNLAWEIDANGLHTTKSDTVTMTAAREAGLKVSVPLHDIEEIKAAESVKVDLALFGHVQATASKPNLPPKGWPALADCCRRANFPVLALGGVNTGDLDTARENGAAGIAAIRGAFGG